MSNNESLNGCWDKRETVTNLWTQGYQKELEWTSTRINNIPVSNSHNLVCICQNCPKQSDLVPWTLSVHWRSTYNTTAFLLVGGEEFCLYWLESIPVTSTPPLPPPSSPTPTPPYSPYILYFLISVFTLPSLQACFLLLSALISPWESLASSLYLLFSTRRLPTNTNRVQNPGVTARIDFRCKIIKQFPNWPHTIKPRIR